MQLSTPTPAKRHPAAKRPPAITYPELPEPGTVSRPLFWRAAWMRSDAEATAFQQHTDAQYGLKKPVPHVLSMAFIQAAAALRKEEREALKSLVDVGGLLYAWLPEGGAQ